MILKYLTPMVLCSAVLLGGCAASPDEEFDFVQMVREYPNRMEFLPQKAPATTRLLERFRPRLVVSTESYPPVDFYRYYLPLTRVLSTPSRGTTWTSPDRARLSEIKDSSSYYLDFLAPAKEERGVEAIRRASPVLYGRVYRDWLVHDGTTVPLLFLKYNPVYAYSGLPPKTSALKSLGARLIGRPRAWHELDIHGAIHVVLHEPTMTPLAVILAQHNHHRTLLVGEDLDWPVDDRILVAASKYSNEPYLITDQGTARQERTVGNPFEMDYLFGRSDRQPLTGGMDLIPTPADGGVEVEVTVEQIPFSDPLYTASISLGDRGKILYFFESWYLSGPPGMDFYTLPQLKNMADLMAFWYVDPEDDEFFRLAKEGMRDFTAMDVALALNHQKSRLLSALRRLGYVGR